MAKGFVGEKFCLLVYGLWTYCHVVDFDEPICQLTDFESLRLVTLTLLAERSSSFNELGQTHGRTAVK
ncbi:hypothetical protein [uncultured Methylophaga sp.]|uniref:hypothetical protein n=1 Tax=uncultured Methylophaga sp. TaxID=285271 RepID=UPI002609FC43|nr:hypothetical protein [uncultured Methylophaga sp.]